LHPFKDATWKKETMVENLEIESAYLGRKVQVDIYGNKGPVSPSRLLLVNDGQDLVTMNFEKMYDDLSAKISSLPIVAAIHCGADRNNEYGMSVGPDFKGWGSRAALYEKFVVSELLTFLRGKFTEASFNQISYAGFSLGALSALDIAWNNGELFSAVGVFSGSLWWRSVDKTDKNYNPWTHRMMHNQIAKSQARPSMKFFFECGEHDEEEDRNHNGVIDSIDDTIDLMRLLLLKGYREGRDFYYLQIPDGRHDVASWSRAFPKFFKLMYGANA
jgi:enterochelin esterase-like enzyme